MTMTDVAQREPQQLLIPTPPTFSSVEEERLHRKQRLAAGFRLFSKCGFDEGVAGHITARDPELTDHFWVNPFGMHFSQVRVSDLILVNKDGRVVEGNRMVNATPGPTWWPRRTRTRCTASRGPRWDACSTR
jgi:hypothetical protein